MPDTLLFRLLADTVLVSHVFIVLFVVGGLFLIIVGNVRGWRWVNRWPFRLLHLAAIVVVAAESWFGLACPLTTAEQWLRARAGVSAYKGSFVERWLHSVIFYEAPAWVFMLSYTAFAIVVFITWWQYPPKSGATRERAA